MVRAVKQASTYIVASRRNGTLYIGVTSNLIQRVWQHKAGCIRGFATTHGSRLLVWFEMHAVMDSAIAREKAIKEWKRAWKIAMIEKSNPYWRDLYDDLL